MTWTTSENMRHDNFLKVYYPRKTQDGDVTQSNTAFLQISGTFLPNGIKTTECGSMGHFPHLLVINRAISFVRQDKTKIFFQHIRTQYFTAFIFSFNVARLLLKKDSEIIPELE